MSQSEWSIFVDTGGTFTDCLGMAPDGSQRRVKVLSSGALRSTVVRREPRVVRLGSDWGLPDGFFNGYRLSFPTTNGWSATVERSRDGGRELHLTSDMPAEIGDGALAELCADEEPPVLAARILTGTALADDFPPLSLRLATTRGTNALLEEKGAKVAFFVTRGFRDLLHISDQTRPDLFALDIRRPEPLPFRFFEVKERLGSGGQTLEQLDRDGLAAAAREAIESGCESAAVVLLNSYTNPAHEEEAARILHKAGFEFVAASAQLAPFIKILSRAETAVVDAYVGPITTAYLDRIGTCLKGGKLTVMTSAGGLVPRERYRPKDSLLSGPAGGVVGAVAIGRQAGFDRLLAFDMGGTSTDVSRFSGAFRHASSHTVGRARLLAPALKIETVAAGGGSICSVKDGQLQVGPESAGASPGPACYGADGPLAVTDVNLLLGRLSTDQFGIPVSPEAARNRFRTMIEEAGLGTEAEEEILQGFLDIANERMADAIRKISVREGYDTSEHALVAFGGAGGMHACAVAELLDVSEVVFPADAGLLSAYGLQRAVLQSIRERQLLRPLADVEAELHEVIREMEREALGELSAEGVAHEGTVIASRTLDMRMVGQESTLTVVYDAEHSVLSGFEERHRAVFGYWPEHARPEVASVKVVAESTESLLERETFEDEPQPSSPSGKQRGYFDGEWREVGLFRRSDIAEGMTVAGPAVVVDPFSALVVDAGWKAIRGSKGTLLLSKARTGVTADTERPEAVERELFTNRFRQLVEEMGLQLQRTALSTNVKERLDFSCALLDAEGYLVANAPHIPVHLGAVGLCVRKVAEAVSMRPGDMIITNHPAFGGSHLPDVTVIAPVFDASELIGYVASRAHHAEIGGIRPGSMPPDAGNLAEEGVIISPTLLYKGGEAQYGHIERLLSGGRFPSRCVGDNLADLQAQASANLRGVEALAALVATHGVGKIRQNMKALRSHAAQALRKRLGKLKQGRHKARQELDDGTTIAVEIDIQDERLIIDFSGTSDEHPSNLNATAAIVQSALVYILRLLVQEDIPLNEGLLDPVEVRLLTCFLNPEFPDNPEQAPAVVGGNVETSQRLVDTLILAFQLLACGQGTMNNLVFGDGSFGYYETICGGAGAGDGFHGADATQVHMTNTVMTDAEVLERRYPVRLLRYERRRGSGGSGKWRGGEGVERELLFLRPLSVSMLTQHRRVPPYGLAGGGDGALGSQTLLRADGTTQELPSMATVEVEAGDRLLIKTPGGGGYGEPTDIR